jgi:hypothetical protein
MWLVRGMRSATFSLRASVSDGDCVNYRPTIPECAGMDKLEQIRELTAMISDPKQWVQNEWTKRIAAELCHILESSPDTGTELWTPKS